MYTNFGKENVFCIEDERHLSKEKWSSIINSPSSNSVTEIYVLCCPAGLSKMFENKAHLRVGYRQLKRVEGQLELQCHEELSLGVVMSRLAQGML